MVQTCNISSREEGIVVSLLQGVKFANMYGIEIFGGVFGWRE